MVITVKKPIRKAGTRRLVRVPLHRPATVAVTQTNTPAPVPAGLVTSIRKAPIMPVRKPAVSKPASKAPVRAAKATKPTRPVDRTMKPGKHGYAQGSAFDTIARHLVKGGESRLQITEDIREAIGETSVTGLPKNVSSMVSSAIRELTARGYTVKQSFKLVPPKN